MLSSFGAASSIFRYRPDRVVIDNFVFMLHYRVTVAILCVAVVLVCSRQYIGEHIRCFTDGGAIPINVINNYCFIQATFTVIRHHDQASVSLRHVAHPGVGPFVEDEDEVRRHNYYQWIPFVLFLQALCFYVPRYIWKSMEGNRMQSLVTGLKMASLSFNDKQIHISKGTVPSQRERRENIARVRKAFVRRIHIEEHPWALYLTFCEVLNVLNLALQVLLNDFFLGGAFLTLGSDVLTKPGYKWLDDIFPKVTKCTFYKYGPSGTLQNHDALCVLAINIVNEKIYLFLWFWFLVLAVATLLGIFWRLFSWLLHSRSSCFNQLLFRIVSPGSVDAWKKVTVTRECHYSDWLFLCYLARNLDSKVFREIFLGLAADLSGSIVNDEESESS